MDNQEDLSLDEHKDQYEEQRGTISRIGITGITYRRSDGMTIFERYLKVGEVAKILGVSTQTVRSYHRKGILVPEIVFDSGHRKYSVEQVEKFIEETLNV